LNKVAKGFVIKADDPKWPSVKSNKGVRMKRMSLKIQGRNQVKHLGACIKSHGILAGLVQTAVICGVSTSAHAIIQSQTRIPLKSAIVRTTNYTPSISPFADEGFSVKRDRNSNAVRLVTGENLFGVELKSFTANEIEQQSLKALLEQKRLFGVNGADVSIVKAATLIDKIDKEDGAVTFAVKRNGVVIQDAGITFRYKFGKLVQVKSESFSEASEIVSQNVDAASVAQQYVAADGRTAPVFSKEVYRARPTTKGYELVKIQEFIVKSSDQDSPSGEGESFVVQVDMASGDVVEARTLNLSLDGSASASSYPRYFEQQSGQTPLSFIVPKNAAGAADQFGRFSTTGSATAPQIQGLTGQFFKVSDLALQPLNGVGQLVNNQWQLQISVSDSPTDRWDNNPMAQSMAYVHLNKIRSTALEFISPTWFNSAITVKVNNSKHCNAYYEPLFGSLNFFTAGAVETSSGKKLTCANTGLIADVMYHEWGHGLDNNTGGIDDHAMSEGFGDAMAMYMTEDSKIGVEFLPLDHQPVRDVSIRKVYPTNIVNEVHEDGLIVGGAWWDLYQGLKAKHDRATARKLMGKFLFKGVYQYAKMLDVYDATVTLDDDNANPADGTPNFCIINTAFSLHGLAEKSPKCRS
jgi:hypothetical protein